MVKRFKHWGILLKTAIGTTPVETGMAVAYWLWAVVAYAGGNEYHDFVATFPISFAWVYTLNRWTAATPLRWIYYASAAMPVLWGGMNLSVDEPVFWVSVLISQWAVVLASRRWDNLTLAQNGWCYLRDGVAAVSMATVGWILVFAIYLSIEYIFDWSFSESAFLTYNLQTAYLLAAPLFFLIFNAKRQPIGRNRFLEVLVNFVFSPALVAYCLILYLYILKIALTGSLPKGGVTYMVLAFLIFMLLIKTVQPFLKRRYFHWFYDYFSWWVFPTVVMLWVAVGVRVREYGLTEMRVYAILAGVLATLTLLAFWTRRWAGYARLLGISIGVFALFSYLPGLTAQDWGIRSQERRIEKQMQWLGPVDSWERTTSNPDNAGRYRHLYESAVYVQNLKGEEYLHQRFGLDRDVMDALHNLGGLDRREADDVRWVYLTDGGQGEMEIGGYEVLERIDDLGKGQVYENLSETGVLTISRAGDTLLTVDINRWLQKRIADLQLDTLQAGVAEKVEALQAEFMVYRKPDFMLIFDYLVIDPSDWTVKRVSPRWLLSKKKTARPARKL